MPSEISIDSNELEIDIEEDESSDDDQTTGNGEEDKETALNLEIDEKVAKQTPAEENAKRQEESWLNKVITGKADVSDAPTWLQGRLNARLEATNKTPETEEVVKKILAAEREATEFKSLQSQIPKLNSAQAQELQERFAKLKPLGKVEALRTALDLMGLSSKTKEAEMRGIAKGRMSLPMSGQPSVKKSGQSVGGVPLDVIHDDKKWNAMIRSGQQN
jgi:antitoxin component HigA of HigAB toxin-antitoxin module